MKKPVLIDAADIEIIWETAARIGRDRATWRSTWNGVALGVLGSAAAASVIIFVIVL
jgi:hypothetical protein